jgi:AcrR family transcriptional regulator
MAATIFALGLLTPKYIRVSHHNMKTTRRPYVMTARAAKAAATKERIRASAIELYCEQAIEDFTLDEVARRAGTTVQTVLRAFGSKEELIMAALGELAASGVPLKPTPPGDVRAAITKIYDLYETSGDLIIQRLADERRRPVLKPALDEGRENHRQWVKEMFAPQLALRRGGDRTQLLDILVVATDIYVWKLLRRDMALSRPAAEAVVCKIITSVTDVEGSHGKDSLAELVGRRQPAA